MRRVNDSSPKARYYLTRFRRSPRSAKLSIPPQGVTTNISAWHGQIIAEVRV